MFQCIVVRLLELIAKLRKDCDSHKLNVGPILSESLIRQCDITAERIILLYFVSRMYMNTNYADIQETLYKMRYTLVRRFTNIVGSIARRNRFLCTLQ